MTPRMSVIGASLRKLFAAIGGAGDYYWNNVVLAMKMDTKSDDYWAKTSLAMHMDDPDPYWDNTVLAMHMDQNTNVDPNYASVTVGMHMDGANASTSFAEVKGATVSVTGNTVISTAQSKFGGASAYFDGNGDYLTVGTLASSAVGAGDFTIEMWVYTPTLPNAQKSILEIGTYGNANAISIAVDSTNKPFVYAGMLPVNSSSALPSAAWVHIAAVRSSSIIKIYTDGVLTGTSSPTSVDFTSTSVRVGAYSAGTTNGLACYIDDLRITKGVARYTANFTPPTAAFPGGVSDFIDEKGKTVTAVGNATLSATQSKFGGYSAYFDGTGDYLTVPNSADFQFGSGDFTIECWFRATSGGAANSAQYYAMLVASDAAGDRGFLLGLRGINSSSFNEIVVSHYDSGGVVIAVNVTTSAVTLNTWHHIAVVRYGSTFTLYLNGVAIGTNTSANALRSQTPTIKIGGWMYDGTYTGYFTGYIDDLRITKGVARYTANFTPPTTPFQAGTGVTDLKGHTITPVGTPALSATQSKFGGKSVLFNGTTDYLTIPTSVDYGFGTGDFTIECWVNTAADGTVLDLRTAASDLGLFAINGGFMSLWNGAAHLQGQTTITTSTWVHLAWVRIKGVVTMYVNGQIDGVSATSATFGTTRPVRVGADYAGANFFNGYIDDLRVTKVGRYNGEFTPAAYPFLEPSNKPLFLEETGKTVAPNGNTSIATVAKFGSGSAYFDGTGDYLTIPASTDFGLGSNPFTVEMWVYTSQSTLVSLIDTRETGSTGADRITVGIESSTRTLFVQLAPTVIGNTGSGIALDQFNHVAVAYNGSTLSGFVNGVKQWSQNVALNLAASCPITVGQTYAGTAPLNGYIDDLRITKGVARYVSNFTPPDKTIPNYSKTYLDPHWDKVVLGLHMDGANGSTTFTDVKGKTVTAVGNAQISTAQYKFGGASGYFDGTGDYLTLADSEDLNFGSGDFTIEFWVNFSALPASGSFNAGLISQAGSSSNNSFVIYYNSGYFTAAVSTNGAAWAVSANVQMTPTTGQWYHLALVRNGTSITLYLSGIPSSPATLSAGATLFNSTRVLDIGTIYSGLVFNSFFNGYIDDLRITKGVARYTQNFQPVQLPFPEKAFDPLPVVSDPHWDKVVLGMHMDGADNGTTFTDVKGKTVSRFGDTKTVTATKKFGTASAYFDGAGDYLSVPNTSDFDFGSGDFTIECWLNMSSLAPAQQCLFFHGVDGGTANSTYAYVDSSGNLSCNTNNGLVGTLATSGGVKVGVWQHIAFVRASGQLHVFINGIGTAGQAGSVTGSYVGCTLRVGCLYSSAWFLNGYIDVLRITKGVARYTADFVPPGRFPEVIPVDLPVMARYWKLTLTPAGSYVGLKEFYLANSSGDLATSGKTYASNNASASSTPVVFDGLSTGEYIYPNIYGQLWVSIDFGTDVAVTSIGVVQSTNDWASSLKLEHSLDGVTWITDLYLSEVRDGWQAGVRRNFVL